MYHYIVSTETGFELKTTTDILAVPDTATMIDKEEIDYYFHPFNDSAYSVYDIPTGPYAGRYLCLYGTKEKRAIKYEVVERAVNEEYRSAFNTASYRFYHRDDGRTCLIRPFEIANYVGNDVNIANRLGLRSNTVSFRNQFFYHIYQSESNTVSSYIDWLLESLHSCLCKTTNISLSKDDLASKLSTKYEIKTKTSNRFTIHLDCSSDVNQVLLINLQYELRGREVNDPCPYEIWIFYIDDVAALKKTMLEHLKEKTTGKRTEAYYRAIKTAANSAIANKGVEYNSSTKLTCADTTKQGKRKFLSTLYALKAHSIRTVVGNYIDSVHSKFSGGMSHNSLRCFIQNRINSDRPHINAIIDEVLKSNEAKEIISKSMPITKASVRKDIFAAIRTELYPITKKK